MKKVSLCYYVEVNPAILAYIGLLTDSCGHPSLIGLTTRNIRPPWLIWAYHLIHHATLPYLVLLLGTSGHPSLLWPTIRHKQLFIPFEYTCQQFRSFWICINYVFILIWTFHVLVSASEIGQGNYRPTYDSGDRSDMIYGVFQTSQ